jgi:Rrf2 family protein
MRITTTSRYGVRAVFDVAYHGAGKPIRIKEVPKRQKISQRYLEQIFNKLLKKKVLVSKRGPHGGYLLAREASRITVKDIIEAAQGPIVPVQCLALDESLIKDKERATTCVTRHVWAQTQKLLEDYFASVTIADLCALARKKVLPREVDHTYMYFI